MLRACPKVAAPPPGRDVAAAAIRLRSSAAAIAALALCTAAPASAAAHTVTYDHYSLKIDGRRTYIWSGEFLYWRLPSPSLWRDVLQKMEAAGYNATSTYFDWGYHSPKPGVYDFKGVRDVDKLLRIADQVGIYVIARPPIRPPPGSGARTPPPGPVLVRGPELVRTGRSAGHTLALTGDTSAQTAVEVWLRPRWARSLGTAGRSSPAPDRMAPRCWARSPAPSRSRSPR